MRFRRPLLAVMLTSFAACGGDDPVDPGNGTVTVQSVTVSPASATIEVGSTQQFSATARNSNGGSVTGVTVSWASSDDQVATVDTNGIATGVGAGSAAITATIGGVAGSQVLSVEPDQCDQRVTVVLTAGQFQTYDATQCLLLPSGAAGDRYRVAFTRLPQVGNPSDVITATVDVTALSALGKALAPSLVADAAQGAPPAQAERPFAGIDGTVFIENMEMRERTRRFHAKLRNQERLMGFGDSLRPDRPMLLGAALPDPPMKRGFNTQFSCSAGQTPAELLVFNDDVAIYQDSVQRATRAISMGAATRMMDYYTNYVRDMITSYFGPLSDIDGNSRLVVTTSPTLADTVAGSVWSGDLSTTGSCPTGNQMEIIYISSDFFADMDDQQERPNYAPLGTLAHEAKHVVSLRHRVVASNQAGAALFHPLWYEEGQAEISESIASRIAWAATGGPALGTAVDGNAIIAAVNANVPRGQTPEMWGIVEKLANLIVNVSTHPNSLLTNPTGANSFHTFYAGAWHLHRFLGDAYGNALTPGADAPFFLALNDASAVTGATRLAQQTGKSLQDHFEELVVAVSLHNTGAPAPALAFTTYDLVTSTSIFTGPEVLAPPGNYPWPVTTNASGTESAGFTTGTYSGPQGPASWRMHDFLSTGTGLGAQLEFDGDPGAKIIITRLR